MHWPMPCCSSGVSFESSTYGAPVVASVSLADGAQRSVHADFREAEPRISIR